MNEFSIIKRYFQKCPFNRSDVIVGSGDDCALLKPPADQLLAVSIDTLISGIHFPKDLSPYDIAYKSLAVNLSDLAAMGAEPAWFTCALTLSEAKEDWLEAFSRGLFELSQKCHIQLVGGDLTHGPVLSITINIYGFVPENLALKRSGAKAGDAIYIGGKLGYPVLQNYYYKAEPQIGLGIALRGKAHAAIDISDGLIADLSHILEASQVGANIYINKIPLVHEAGLYAGDDYILCFTGPKHLEIEGHTIYEIGEIQENKKLNIYQPDGSLYVMNKKGYQHF